MSDRPVRWQRARRPVRLVVLVAMLVFIGLALASRWSEVGPLLHELSVASLVLAGASVLAGIFTSFLGWRVLLHDLGGDIPMRAGMRIFFVSQFGKYIPGSVWPVLAQTELGTDYGVPRRSSAAAVVVAQLVAVATGLLVGLAGLPLLGSSSVARYWWALLLLPVAACGLWPPLMNRLAAWALRRLGRERLPQPLTLGGVGRAAACYVLGWALYGVQIWALAHTLGGSGDLLYARSTSAFAASWCVGFLLVVAPAGLGAREATLVLLLRASIGGPAATVVAVVSRLLFTAADLAWGGAAVLAEHLRRRAAVTSAAGGRRRDGRDVECAPSGADTRERE